MSNELICIDVSHWQNNIDFEQVASGGVRGVILKATEGTSYMDPTYTKRRAQAADADLLLSSYHFLKHGDIDAQMAHYLKAVSPGPGERVVIDFEDSQCTLDDLRSAVTFLSAENLQVTVYGANGFLGALLGGKKDDILAQTSLWVASYTSASSPTVTNLKGTWPHWSLWQYTDCATVEGVVGPCDGNRFNGSNDAFEDWMMPAAGLPSAPDLIQPTPLVTVNIESDTPIDVRITLGPGIRLIEGD